MRLSIAGKIITFVVVAVALSCTAVLLTTMRLLEPPLDASIEGTTQLAKAATDATYNANSEKFLKEARLIAQNPELIEAVTRRDHAAAAAIGKELMEMAGSEFITITDEKGMVVARGHSPKYGDDVNNQETVSAGRHGKSVVGVVTGTVVPFTLRAGAPLMRDGKVAGTVGIGISLTSEAYVDKLKKDTGLEATIFRDDVRAMTTLMQDGKRLIGTRLQNAAVSEAVLQRGETVSGRLELLGRPFSVVYWPILNMAGKPWACGLPASRWVMWSRCGRRLCATPCWPRRASPWSSRWWPLPWAGCWPRPSSASPPMPRPWPKGIWTRRFRCGRGMKPAGWPGPCTPW